MNQLLLATTNKAKIEEMRDSLKDFRISLVSLKRAGVSEKPEETGKTFAENAFLKARFYARKTRLPALADDGGLEIDALGGWPGVHSHRIDGVEAGDEELIKRVLERLEGIPVEKRSARFTLVAVVMLPDGRALMDTESAEGIIADKPSLNRKQGYPYRSIFWLPRHQKYFIDLAPEEHEETNHRTRLLARLKPKIVKFLESRRVENE